MREICDSSIVLRDVARRAAGPATGVQTARQSIDDDEKASRETATSGGNGCPHDSPLMKAGKLDHLDPLVSAMSSHNIGTYSLGGSNFSVSGKTVSCDLQKGIT